MAHAGWTTPSSQRSSRQRRESTCFHTTARAKQLGSYHRDQFCSGQGFHLLLYGHRRLFFYGFKGQSRAHSSQGCSGTQPSPKSPSYRCSTLAHGRTHFESSRPLAWIDEFPLVPNTCPHQVAPHQVAFDSGHLCCMHSRFVKSTRGTGSG